MAASRESLHAHLDAVLAEARELFGHFHHDKLAQLESHVGTAKMVVDDLHDTVPPDVATKVEALKQTLGMSHDVALAQVTAKPEAEPTAPAAAPDSPPAA